MNPYVDLARSSLGDTKWKVIAGKDDSGVRAAHKRLAELVKENWGTTTEDIFYGPTIQLCNHISLAVFDQVKDSRPAADQDVAYIFTVQAGNEPKCDFLSLKYTPDYCCLAGTRDELEVAAATPFYARSVCWPEMEMVGEQKTWGDNGKGQIKSYLSALKRYRPDLPTVHGFLAYHGKIQLSELNACGMWNSSSVDVDDIDMWIAFVVLLYQSYQHRDQKLVYNARQTEFLRWDFVDRPDQTPLVLAPFYAAQAPGRVTFASFEVASGAVEPPKAAESFYGSEVQGFWKTSWQQQGRSKERELLDRLHAGDRWLPGLVRPYPEMHGDRLRVPTLDDMVRRAQNAIRHETPVAEDLDADVASTDCTGESSASSGYTSTCTLDDDEEGGDAEESAFISSMPTPPRDFVERVQEIVRLASIGEPLSQCESPRELLFCAYDLLETHIHMWEEGVLHRDVSWFNVLCNPKHYRGNEADAKARPCIKKILHSLGHDDASTLPVDNAGGDLSSCVLLTDLDHAIDKQELKKAVEDDGRERTGTPMFISCELSNHCALQYYPLSSFQWDTLSEALNLVEELDLGAAALTRAFPDDNDRLHFMHKFNQVMELEATRKRLAPLSERPVHSPRHDAESIYWIFLWAFARARPRRAPHETDEDRIEQLTRFAKDLLHHEVGKETKRRPYLEPQFLQNLFHPSLAAFEGLFSAMATYLSVPWHLYGDIVEENHVHIAFRRMILGYLLRTDRKLLDLLLDTEQPRRLNVTDDDSTPERKTPAWSQSLSAVGGSGRANLQDPLPSIPERKKKTAASRKTVAAGIDGSGPSSGGGAGPSSAPDRPIEPQSSNTSTKRKASKLSGEPPPKRVKTGGAKSSSRSSPTLLSPALRARQATRYSYTLHFRDRNAHALRLKTWKDRLLWFSKGY